MIKRMNPRALKHFLALAEHLHFGRASDACHISTSALSRNIRQLEEELGAELFNRDNRTVALTEQGQQFLHYARETTAQWSVIRNELSNNTGPLHGEISMYCSVTASYSILFDLLNQLRQNHPGIEIKLHTGDPEHAIARVVAGQEDITIAARPNTLPRGIEFKHITYSPLVFIAPKISSSTEPNDFTTPPPKSAAQWATVPMILTEGGVARNRIDAWFKKRQVSPRIYAQVAGNEAIVSMVSLGLGIGVVPQIVIDHSPMADRIQILNVKPQLEPYDIGLLTLKKHLKNPMIKAFWELL